MSAVESVSGRLLRQGSWSVERARSSVEFRVRHMVFETVRGWFRDFDGTIATGAEPLVAGSVRVASVDTLHGGRDEHLRSPDFFDVARHPEIAFRARGLPVAGTGGRLALAGGLTIKRITRPLVLDGELQQEASDADGRGRIVLALRGRLSRSDYGLFWNRLLDSGDVLVGDSVELRLLLAAARVG